MAHVDPDDPRSPASGDSAVLRREGSAGASPRRILIIDDEPLVRRGLQRGLRGHRITAAISGDAAITLLSTERDFDLILCDVMMPGMSGLDVLDWLLANAPSLASRLVFMTGGVFSVETATRLGAVTNSVMEKPLSMEYLVRLVAHLPSDAGKR